MRSKKPTSDGAWDLKGACKGDMYVYIHIDTDICRYIEDIDVEVHVGIDGGILAV